MDKELQEAQNLTKNDLLAKLRSGRPAELVRHPLRDLNSTAASTEPATIELRWLSENATIFVDSSSFGPEAHGIMVSSPTGVSVS